MIDAQTEMEPNFQKARMLGLRKSGPFKMSQVGTQKPKHPKLLVILESLGLKFFS